MQSDLQPSFVVESSPGKYHVYWLIDDCSLDKFSDYQKALAETFGGDPSVTDLPRVMRVPGFLHQKDPNSPFQVREHYKSDAYYTVDNIERFLSNETAKLIIEEQVKCVYEAWPGERNSTLNKSAYIAFGFVKARKADYNKVYQQLFDAAIDSGLEKSEIEATLKSAWKGAKAENAMSVLPDSGVDSLLVTTDKGKKLLIESKAALVLSQQLQGRLAYDPIAQTWYKFTGTHWDALPSAKLPDKTIIELITRGTGDLGFKPVYKNGIKSLLEEGGLLPLPENDTNKLPFQNGLLDLKTRKLQPVSASNALTWCLPYEYNPNAGCPKTVAWLNDALEGHQDVVNFLLAFMAACLHGRSDLQKFLHLKGAGGTGKGTFMRLLTVLIGEQNTAVTKLDRLETNRFETATLYNKRLAIITDSDKYGGSIDSLKAITGQDNIPLERKYQQQCGSFVFQGLVVMASNESLQVTDHTSGLDRRRLTVIFDRRATNEERQNWQKQGGEEAVLHTEIPGLINRLLQFTDDQITEIINNPPRCVKQADFEAMRSTNSIADWITECCEADHKAWTQIGNKQEYYWNGGLSFKNVYSWLYASYIQYCHRVNKAPFSVRRFRELMIQTCTTLGIGVYESRRSAGMGIVGLKIKPSEYDEEDVDFEDLD